MAHGKFPLHRRVDGVREYRPHCMANLDRLTLAGDMASTVSLTIVRCVEECSTVMLPPVSNGRPIKCAGELRDRILSGVYGYWSGKCRDGRLPARRDIDPSDIPHFLAHIFLVEVHRAEDRFRFRFRLVGTGVVEWIGRDATGRFMDDPWYGERGKLLQGHYEEVATDGVARYYVQYAAWVAHARRSYCKLLLPMADDGRCVDMILGCFQASAD